MRLLVLNWQDIENPQAGGAEIHLHEIFGRLASRGHEITLLCGGWPGCPTTTTIDRMTVMRAGRRYSFPWHVRSAYRRLRAQGPGWDLVVEDINKVPLYTPRWVREPVVGLIPHLFGGTAFQEVPAPVAAAVWLAERPIPTVYRDTPFQVISQSTADDLQARGIPRDHIAVIYCGIDSTTYTPDAATRAVAPVFAYLGRLKRYKRVDLILRAFARLAHPSAVLEIAGSGDYRGELERLSQSLDLGSRVRFLGRISEEEKVVLLRRAWALVFTSPKEGWGITNLEAAASGTPVIASNSPGIRESVRDGETGFLVPHGDVERLTQTMARIAAAPSLVDTMGRAARAFATTFTWERAATETEHHLQSVLDRRKHGSDLARA